ncbi:MAG: hypothetical protein HQ582_12785 [Planctomycetes bacterium]|nr:hypothetical protein [Planctomycetota bacterium]
MTTSTLEKHFARMGAEVHVTEGRRRGRRGSSTFAVDVRNDRKGSFFDITLGREGRQEVEVLDVRPGERHLLLLVRNEAAGRAEKHKFLCGHDERDWFVAAVPDARGVSNVATAMEALKPEEVRQEQVRRKVKPRHRNRRKNAAFVRQGEWFFIPCPDLVVDAKLILRGEPLVRGGGKPHRVDELYRSGGETVYVARGFPQGLTSFAYVRLLARYPDKKHLHWKVMRRNPEVYVRGRVRHGDHKTVVLDCWHLVRMNTETQAAAMQHVAFLD